MGTRDKRPSITIREFWQLEDEICRQIEEGVNEFRADELAETCDLTQGKVNEALLHLSRNHSHVTDIGGGEWRIEPPG